MPRAVNSGSNHGGLYGLSQMLINVRGIYSVCIYNIYNVSLIVTENIEETPAWGYNERMLLNNL